MLANERQLKICKMLEGQGAVTTSELMAEFNVSIETVRRDLLILEKENKLRRVHGGAVTEGGMKHFHELSKRTEENSEGKQYLSQLALQFVSNGDTIGIDAGSTAIEFARALKSCESLSSLTAVTHSLDVFEILCRHRDFKLILCAGNFMAAENTFYGPIVLDTLSKLHVEKIFLFPSALSLQFGICDHQPELFEVQKMLMLAADKAFVLADSSKFEKSALLKIDDMSKKYTYVTDSALSAKLKKLYRENEINIITEKDDIK